MFPLRLAETEGPGYITLREAIARSSAVVTEVSEGGSVPELRVLNTGEARILVLDGEELRGAKQNRILNTSILIGARSSLLVPVSCTEQGRWSYASREFDESEVVADRQVRYAMKDSISVSLASGAGHRSDQGRVWREVGELHQRHGTVSPTAAMRDAYQSRKPDLDAVLAAFPLQEGQQGMLVLHGARVVGLDLVSRAPQYAELHDKLLRSYAFEALVRDGEPGDRAVADAFLERIADLPGRRYKSPGLGWDVRYEGGGVLGPPSPIAARRCTPRSSTSAACAALPLTTPRAARAARARTGASPTRASEPAGARSAEPAQSPQTKQAGGDHGSGQARQGLQGRRPHHSGEAAARRPRAGARPGRGRGERRGGGRGAVRPRRVGATRPRRAAHRGGHGRRRQAHAAARAAAHRQLPGPGVRRRARRIRTFVETGGSLFTTDWALKHVVEPAFSGVLAFDKAPTRDDVVRIEVLDADNIYLQGVLDGQDDPQWWLEASSYPISVVDEERVKVLITSRELGEKYGERPVAVWFRWGEGDVFHMISHYYLQRTAERTARHAASAGAYFAEQDLPLSVEMSRDLAELSLADVESAKPSTAFMSNVIIEKKRRQRRPSAADGEGDA